MKILFLTDNFPPETNAPATRTFEHCKEWVNKGVEVTVITCTPNFPKGKVFPGYKNKLYQKEEVEGIKVIRVWSFITANEGFIKRILDYLSFAITSFFAGLFVKTDLIVATSPQFFTAVSGSLLSILKRKKWVFEVRDLWPETILAIGAMKRNLAIRFFEWLEKQLYFHADHIVVVTDTFKRKISDRGIDSDKITVRKNGANLDLFKPQKKDSILEKELGLEGKKVFAYIGTHGMCHGLSFILNAIKPLMKSHQELAFLFIGDGAEKKNLIEQAKNLELKNVVFVDSVAKQEVPRYLSLMDIALVNLVKSETFLTVIPSKIFEAAAMKKPLLLGLEGETKDIIEKYAAGVCYEPENQKEFHLAVQKILEPDTFFKSAKGAEKLAIDFDRKIIADDMLKDLMSIGNFEASVSTIFTHK